jgi:hypothetical protein
MEIVENTKGKGQKWMTPDKKALLDDLKKFSGMRLTSYHACSRKSIADN